ncbi:ABC transporter permease [Aureimonas fodinaquatilis]|uniref:ABC transporter permease n=1 Tax=Aureimonas fodinaquatilis TaxID=2565783 RepID=A0A5B0DWL6_9HYPH|nr:ABC transporter permease [Aureimonas fodinaquatilis]KAA0970886.1 ABC transporter permease [Aureimonas fodinaquatilis]
MRGAATSLFTLRGPFPRSFALALPFVLPLALLLLWQLAVVRNWVSPLILPPPLRIWQTFVELWQNGQIAEAFMISLFRIAVGFAAGAAGGLIVGMAMGLSDTFDRIFGPTLRTLAQVPTIGWMPILILVLGLSEAVKYIIIAKASFLLVLIATADAIRNVPRDQVDAMRVLRLRPMTQLTKFWIPAVLPSIVTGFRLALGAAWIALVIVEMLASTAGIGYLMVWGRTVFQLDVVVVGMIIIGLAGLSLDRVMALLERRVSHGVHGHG